mmetsp:Transcript_1108/g.3426  ORF Transcript_1108/g.3426 Transcript_1108/m.3426 type:complete len:203 (-) Transcript_1108:489-1097(-)
MIIIRRRRRTKKKREKLLRAKTAKRITLRADGNRCRNAACDITGRSLITTRETRRTTPRRKFRNCSTWTFGKGSRRSSRSSPTPRARRRRRKVEKRRARTTSRSRVRMRTTTRGPRTKEDKYPRRFKKSSRLIKSPSTNIRLDAASPLTWTRTPRSREPSSLSPWEIDASWNFATRTTQTKKAILPLLPRALPPPGEAGTRR